MHTYNRQIHTIIKIFISKCTKYYFYSLKIQILNIWLASCQLIILKLPIGLVYLTLPLKIMICRGRVGDMRP